MKVTIAVEGIGNVLFEQSLRAKRVNISVRPVSGVRVAVPKQVSFEAAREFFNSRIQWVRKHLEKIENYRQNSDFVSIGEIDKKAAKVILVSRIAELAEKHGFQYCKVTLRSQKTRWGSCSSRNNISLNIRLAGLPEQLRDYVLLHELVHTRIKNHSKEFWAELGKYVPNARAVNKQLHRYSWN